MFEIFTSGLLGEFAINLARRILPSEPRETHDTQETTQTQQTQQSQDIPHRDPITIIINGDHIRGNIDQSTWQSNRQSRQSDRQQSRHQITDNDLVEIIRGEIYSSGDYSDGNIERVTANNTINDEVYNRILPQVRELILSIRAMEYIRNEARNPETRDREIDVDAISEMITNNPRERSRLSDYLSRAIRSRRIRRSGRI